MHVVVDVSAGLTVAADHGAHCSSPYEVTDTVVRLVEIVVLVPSGLIAVPGIPVPVGPTCRSDVPVLLANGPRVVSPKVGFAETPPVPVPKPVGPDEDAGVIVVLAELAPEGVTVAEITVPTVGPALGGPTVTVVSVPLPNGAVSIDELFGECSVPVAVGPGVAIVPVPLLKGAVTEEIPVRLRGFPSVPVAVMRGKVEARTQPGPKHQFPVAVSCWALTLVMEEALTSKKTQPDGSQLADSQSAARNTRRSKVFLMSGPGVTTGPT